MIGPNEAPNPAHAKETSFKIVSVFPQAKPNAMRDTNRTEIRPRSTYVLSLASLLIIALYNSLISADDVKINYEEILLNTAAKKPANIIPAINGWKIICPNSIKIASASLSFNGGFCWKYAIP